jgi:NADPH:quinone reductase-like Zn-dependent oxidoreductase
MKASGDQLRQLAALIDAGAIRPVVDRVFLFESTNEALAYAVSVSSVMQPPRYAVSV